MKHVSGTLKEIKIPSYTNFETVCRDILIESRLFIATQEVLENIEKEDD